MAYKSIEDRRAYHRKYMKEYRENLKKYHLCMNCKNQDAYTLNNHLFCYECTCKRLGHEPIIREKKTKQWTLPRNERSSHNLCYKCGKPSLNIEKKWGIGEVKLCKECYEKNCENAKIRKRKISVPICNTKNAWENYNKLKASEE